MLCWSKSYYHGALIIVSLLNCLQPGPWAFIFHFPLLFLPFPTMDKQELSCKFSVWTTATHFSLLQRVCYSSWLCYQLFSFTFILLLYQVIYVDIYERTSKNSWKLYIMKNLCMSFKMFYTNIYLSFNLIFSWILNYPGMHKHMYFIYIHTYTAYVHKTE